MKVNNNQLFQQLRKDYHFFEYKSYSYEIKDEFIEAYFHFNLSNKIEFKPSIKVYFRDFISIDTVKEPDLRNFIFHMGMVELISYWKAACPKEVIIKAHKLDDKQVEWWKKLYFLGLGEFFYLNSIDTDENSFMTINSQGEKLELSNQELSDDEVLVPIGGGKDSIVTLELLKRAKCKVIPLIVNPRAASIRTINISGYNENESVIINRTIDAKLLELNRKGFLNGHTPFSAMLAFTSVFVGLISGISNIALSNESSANESTVPGSKINHQYSKSFEFEKDFEWYVKTYMHKGIAYFSFLRPVNELQIAKLFSLYTNHYSSFRSCNVGSKTDSWCGICPKCLFTYTILSPFIKKDYIVDIFQKNMFQDKSLSKIMDELTGISEVKPFECVGTPDEVIASLKISSKQYPEIFNMVNINALNNGEKMYESLLKEYNTENLIPEKYESIIKSAIYV